MMSEKDEKLMADYGITSESKTVYRYKEYRYKNLEDAIRYAIIDAERADNNTDLKK